MSLRRVPLLEIADINSEYKNNIYNIGITPAKPEYYPILKRQLTVEKLQFYCKAHFTGEVRRYTWDQIAALNFVCFDTLHQTVRHTFSKHLLQMEVEI